MKSGGVGGRGALRMVRSATHSSVYTGPGLAAAKTVLVRFVDDDRGRPALLVETADRGTLLFVVVRAIYKIGVRMARSKITMRHDRMLHWFYLVEHDGAPLDLARQRQVEGTVTSAIAAMDRIEGWLVG